MYTFKSLWTIHNGVFDAPTVYILTWPRFAVSVLQFIEYKDNT